MVGSAVADPPNFKKYGVPSYSVAWIPPNVIKSVLNQTTVEASDNADSSTPQPPEQSGEHYLAITGGGGEGSSGIPNAVLLAHFDVASNSLSDQPVCYSFAFSIPNSYGFDLARVLWFETRGIGSELFFLIFVVRCKADHACLYHNYVNLGLS